MKKKYQSPVNQSSKEYIFEYNNNKNLKFDKENEKYDYKKIFGQFYNDKSAHL